MASNNPELNCIGASCQSLTQLDSCNPALHYSQRRLTNSPQSPNLFRGTVYMMPTLLNMTMQTLKAAADTELSVSLTVT